MKSNFLSIFFFIMSLALHADPLCMYTLKRADGYRIDLIGNEDKDLDAQECAKYRGVITEFYNYLHNNARDTKFFAFGMEDSTIAAELKINCVSMAISYMIATEYPKTTQWQIIDCLPVCSNQKRSKILLEVMELLEKKDGSFRRLLKEYLAMVVDDFAAMIKTKVNYVLHNAILKKSLTKEKITRFSTIESEIIRSKPIFCDKYYNRLEAREGLQLVLAKDYVFSVMNDLGLANDRKNAFLDYYMLGKIMSSLCFYCEATGMGIIPLYLHYAFARLTTSCPKTIYYVNSDMAAMLKDIAVTCGFVVEKSSIEETSPEQLRTFLMNAL